MEWNLTTHSSLDSPPDSEDKSLAQNHCLENSLLVGLPNSLENVGFEVGFRSHAASC